MKLTGSNAHAYLGFYKEENVVETGGVTEAGKLYLIMRKKASCSGIPASLPEGTFFKAPSEGSQITAADGDRLLKIDPQRLCKTSADFSLEQGSVDAGDDCDPGAQILDGIVTISGSISGLFRYDEETQEFDDVTNDIINHFLPVVEDSGTGVYTRHPRDDSRTFLMVLLNGDAKEAQIENWLFVPVNIASVSFTLGNTGAQTRDLSWTKAEGEAVKYSVPRAA
jgi:hypothetical protein